MKVFILKFFMVCFFILCAGTAGVNAQESTAPPTRTPVQFKRIAVAPVLVGHRLPHIDETLDDTLSCPINQICIDDPAIKPGAGDMMARLIHAVLKEKFGARLVAPSELTGAYDTLRMDPTKDTPRTLAHRLGKAIPADLIIIGTVWRYRDRGSYAGVPDQPASVGFALYLVETESGRQLWRGIFDENQDFALNDLARFTNRIKMGLTWLTADELARYGVEKTMRLFPEDVIPVTGNPPVRP